MTCARSMSGICSVCDPLDRDHMTLPKIQHYVPQFYLRRFAERKKKGHFIFCYDKQTGRVFQTHVRNVASEKGFYDLKYQGKTITLEPSLARMESQFHKVFDELLDDGILHEITQESRIAIAPYVALQMFRIPAHRKSFEHQIAFFSKIAPEPMTGMPDIAGKALHVLFLAQHLHEFAAILASMKWMISHNRTGKPLWTSDNPVFNYNFEEPIGPMFSNLGLLCQGIQVHFPLSHEYALMMCDPERFSALPPYFQMEEDNVVWRNCGQVMNSTRYLFGPSEDFEMADRYLTEHPEYRNPNRALVEIVG